MGGICIHDARDCKIFAVGATSTGIALQLKKIINRY